MKTEIKVNLTDEDIKEILLREVKKIANVSDDMELTGEYPNLGEWTFASKEKAEVIDAK